MKTAILTGLAILALLSGCVLPESGKDDGSKVTVNQQVVTSADGAPEGSIHNLERGCYVMKKIGAEEYDCFGCVGDSCKEEDLELWD